VVRDTQGSYTFPSAMTPKSLRYKVMGCAIMLKIFCINWPNGRLSRYFLQGCREGYAERSSA